jgi:hypothetical protein
MRALRVGPPSRRDEKRAANRRRRTMASARLSLVSRLTEEFGAPTSGPGLRWIVARAGANSDVHVLLASTAECDEQAVWVFDPRAALGDPATYVSIVEERDVENLVATIRRAADSAR